MNCRHRQLYQTLRTNFRSTNTVKNVSAANHTPKVVLRWTGLDLVMELEWARGDGGQWPGEPHRMLISYSFCWHTWIFSECLVFSTFTSYHSNLFATSHWNTAKFWRILNYNTYKKQTIITTAYCIWPKYHYWTSRGLLRLQWALCHCRPPFWKLAHGLSL